MTEAVKNLCDKGGEELLRNAPEQSLALYNQALGIDPRDMEAQIGKGQALMVLGRFAEATPFFMEAISRLPGNIRGQEGLILCHLQPAYWFGLAALKLGKFEKARELLRTALAARPDWPAALRELGRAEAGLENYAAALAYLERAAKTEHAAYDLYMEIYKAQVIDRRRRSRWSAKRRVR